MQSVIGTVVRNRTGQYRIVPDFPQGFVFFAGAKQTELIAVLHQSGNLRQLSRKPFSVDPAGTVSMDGDDDPGSVGMQSWCLCHVYSHQRCSDSPGTHALLNPRATGGHLKARGHVLHITDNNP